MRLPAAQCCVCSRSYVNSEFTMFKIEYGHEVKDGHGGFEKVHEWWSGIRVVCKWCLIGFQKLTGGDDARSSQHAPGP